MPKPANKPNKIGEHQKLEDDQSSSGQPAVEDDDSRTERMPPLKAALEASEKLWEQGTRES